MPGQSISEHLKVVDEFIMLLHESAEFHTKRVRAAGVSDTNDESIALIFRDTGQNMQRLRTRLLSTSQRAVVTFVGLTNVGKSTLLNALLGADVAPRRNGPCTAAPIEFSYAPQLNVTAIYSNRIKRSSWQPDNVSDLHKRLAELAEEDANASGARPKKVIVEMPSPVLQTGLVIADTPGFGAVQSGEREGQHEESVRQYLMTEANQVFWVVLAELGIGKYERGMYDQFFADICDDVIVTGSEDLDTNDRLRFRKRFAGLLGSGNTFKKNPTFHFVSGTKGLDARLRTDTVALEAAGITALETRIREMAKGPVGVAGVENGLLQLAHDLRYWLFELRDTHGRHVKPWWRQDSFARFASLSTRLPFHATIVQALRPPGGN